MEGSGNHGTPDASGLASALGAEASSTSRSPMFWGMPTRVARVAASIELLAAPPRRSAAAEAAEEMETTDGALMLTTAEEADEQWLTITDCTDDGKDACESVSLCDRVGVGAPPASCWRIERSGGRVMLVGSVV